MSLALTMALGLATPAFAGGSGRGKARKGRVEAGAGPAFPLKVSENGRYLVDQSGRPFRIQGDSAQSLIANLTYGEAEIYLAKRKAQGFNTVNVNLFEHKFAVKAPADRNGDAPFLKAGDFSTPNEKYFAYADRVIELAASKGMLVSLAVMYLGYDGGDEGWWKELNAPENTQAVCFKLGLYVGNRYKQRKNILWVIGGDYTPPAGSEGEARLHKFMEGVKAAGGAQLWAGDWNAPCLSTDEAAFAAAMDLNAVYSSGSREHQGATYEEARRAYAYSPAHPAYLKETGYEDEAWVPGDAASVRKYEYWAILGGATEGGFFGNRDVWEFATGNWWSGFKFGHKPWQQALDSPGALDMMRLGKLLDEVRWYELAPLGGGVKIADGQRTETAIAAATSDRRMLLAYVPPTAKKGAWVTVEAGWAEGMRGRWYDPTSGEYKEIRGESARNGQGTEFVTPGANAAGASDWVLVLEKAK